MIKNPSFVYFKIVVYRWKLILEELSISYMTSSLFTFVFTLFTVTYTIWNKKLRHEFIPARVQNRNFQIFVHPKWNLCDIFIK